MTTSPYDRRAKMRGGEAVPTDVTGRPLALRVLDLNALFKPKTVAIIGASDVEGRPHTAMFNKVRAKVEAGGGTVYPVNPTREEVAGLRCYPSIQDVPVDVDLAVILVGDAVEALRAAVEKGARFAVIFAAGFAEAGPEGEVLQARLAELIEGSDTHVLGPNTNLNAFETFREGLPGRPIALITQSGHQGRPIFQAQEMSIAQSHWAPTGNEVDLEFADFARYFVDRGVGVIAGYLEGFKDGRTMVLAADHAMRQGVPIVLVKVGRTAEGISMAKSHTGHLTGRDAVMEGVFRQYGITRVDDLDQLLDTGAMFARAGPPRGDGVCVYAISGGTGAHMTDLAAEAGLRLPRLTEVTQRSLREWIPSYLRVDNPVDSGGGPSADWRGRKILDAIVSDPEVALLIVPITGAVQMPGFPSIADRMAQDLVDVSRTTDKAICVVWGSPLGDEPAYRDVLLPSGLPVFRSFRNCVRAVKAFLDYHGLRHAFISPFDAPVLEPSPASAEARALLTPGRTMSEHASKRVLAAYGILLPREELVRSAGAAARAARSIGFPVAVKLSSPDLLHKTELGLVRLGLRTAGEVRAACTELLEHAAVPGVAVEGILVAEMVPRGVETVVGISQDELFGPAVMFGIGGVFLEVLRDVTFRVPPFPREEARRMVGEVRGFPLLTGARGRPPANLEALVEVIMAVQRIALDLSGEIAELDVNPLVALPDRAVALDALVVSRS